MLSLAQIGCFATSILNSGQHERYLAIKVILLNGFTDIRLILMKYHFQSDIWHIEFLHWDDGSHLEILDEKVAKDTFTDEDFKNAVITRLGRTKCFECNWEGYTLVFFTAEAYIGAPELEQQKMQARQSRNGFGICPNCGAKLRQMVVKILDLS